MPLIASYGIFLSLNLMYVCKYLLRDGTEILITVSCCVYNVTAVGEIIIAITINTNGMSQ